jgi:predicted short-subunit dehydrogenase-like oxidoreductase (DUF2520 family)
MTRLAIVGPGRAGHALQARCEARAIASSLSRDPQATAGADIVVLAVPDDAIADVATTVPGSPWLGMLSGATPLTALGWGPRRFVLHPAQTLSAEGGSEQLDGVTAFVTGASAEALGVATQLAGELGLRALPLPESARPLPHAACVLASNYVVTLVASAVDLLARAGISRDDAVVALEPLVQQTVANAFREGGELRPTGPVARGDAGTIVRHLEALAATDPELGVLYRVLGQATLPLVAPASAARVAEVLRNPGRTE